MALQWQRQHTFSGMTPEKFKCTNTTCIISRPVLLHPHNTEASRVALGVVPIYHLAAQPSPELCQPLLVCFDLPVSLGPILVHKRNFPLALGTTSKNELRATLMLHAF